MVRRLRAQDIPQAVKTVRVAAFDKEGVSVGTRDVRASYFWRTADGRQFIGQATAREKEMFAIDKDDPAPTIQVSKYGIDGTFKGGPWTVKAAT